MFCVIWLKIFDLKVAGLIFTSNYIIAQSSYLLSFSCKKSANNFISIKIISAQQIDIAVDVGQHFLAVVETAGKNLAILLLSKNVWFNFNKISIIQLHFLASIQKEKGQQIAWSFSHENNKYIDFLICCF